MQLHVRILRNKAYQIKRVAELDRRNQANAPLQKRNRNENAAESVIDKKKTVNNVLIQEREKKGEI